MHVALVQYHKNVSFDNEGGVILWGWFLVLMFERGKTLCSTVQLGLGS